MGAANWSRDQFDASSWSDTNATLDALDEVLLKRRERRRCGQRMRSFHHARYSSMPLRTADASAQILSSAASSFLRFSSEK